MVNPEHILLPDNLVNYLQERIRELKDELFASDFDETKPIEYVKQHNYSKGIVAAFTEIINIHNEALMAKLAEVTNNTSDQPLI